MTSFQWSKKTGKARWVFVGIKRKTSMVLAWLMEAPSLINDSRLPYGEQK